MIDTIYKDKDPNKLNAWLKNIWNNYFLKRHELVCVLSNGATYRIIYHRFYWFWQDKWSIKETLSKFHSYHYQIWLCYANGGSCEVDHGTTDRWFPKKKMRRILNNSARYWNRIFEEKNNECKH